MEPEDIAVFRLYQAQLSNPNGRDRDDLPYSVEYEKLRRDYNNKTGQTLSEREFWLHLKLVLKYGIDKIEQFLSQDRPPPKLFDSPQTPG